MKIHLLIFLLVSLISLGVKAQMPIKVACVGNSITEGAGLHNEQTYPAQLAKLLGDKFVVRNFGVGGRTVLKKGDYPYWNESKYQQALEWKPDVLVILFGANDAKPQNWKYEKEFESDYREMIRVFKKASPGIKIFVGQPLPVFKEAFGISPKVVEKEVSPLVREVASKEKAELIHFFGVFNKQSDKLPDGVHPNAEGAKLMAEAVYKSITKKSEVPK